MALCVDKVARVIKNGCLDCRETREWMVATGEEETEAKLVRGKAKNSYRISRKVHNRDGSLDDGKVLLSHRLSMTSLATSSSRLPRDSDLRSPEPIRAYGIPSGIDGKSNSSTSQITYKTSHVYGSIVQNHLNNISNYCFKVMLEVKTIHAQGPI